MNEQSLCCMKLSLYRSSVIILALFFSLATSVALKAQNPQFISVDRNAVDMDVNSRMMCNNDAGTMSGFGPFIGQSNDATPDTIFLCFGDSIFVNHDDASTNLSGDPVTSTPPGIGYAFFNCPPTVSGPAIENIAADPCVLTSETLTAEFGFFVDSGAELDADQWFWNLGQIQGAFPNAGQSDPRIVHFAPVTFDAINATTTLAVYERENNDPGNPAGQCVNVSTAASFAIAYLNQIEIDEVVSSGCQGSFRVRGGLDQLLPGNEYTVTLTLTTDPSITGTAETSGVGHDEVVNFTVPQPGDYTITVEDGKSCGATRVVNMGSCDAVTFNFPFENHTVGESFCVGVSVEGFTDVLGFSYTMNYDPTVLQFTGVNTPNASFPELNAGDFNGMTSGEIRVAYANFNPLAPTTLADGSVIYELCFTAIGNEGTCSPLQFTGTPLPIEVIVSDGNGGQMESGFVMNDGAVCLSSAPFFVQLDQSPVSCTGEADGCITVTAAGGQAPYEVAYRRLSPMPEPFSTPVDVLNNATDDISYCGLISGFYAAIVEDADGTVIIDTIEVGAPAAIGLTIRDTLPSCFGANDGRIGIIVTLDGNQVFNPVNAGYTFVWEHTSENTDHVIDLDAPATYNVTVTSPSGCSVSASLPLGDPARVVVLPMDPTTAVTDATCSGSEDGSITISAAGGSSATGDYTFNWSTNDAATGSSVTLDNLDPGNYMVTVTDDNGCAAISTFAVSADKILSVNAVVENISCFGADDGSIFATGVTTFNIPNGTPDLPYTFNWSSNATAPTTTNTTTQIENLPPGTYTLSMTDNAGCMIDTMFTVSEPTLLQIADLILTNETCETGSDGSATVVVTGGTLPYTYTWSHSVTETDSIAENMVAGMNYSVTVTDANNCTQVQNFDISSPMPPQVVSLNDAFLSCPESTDGTLTVVATDGSASIISYQWADEDGNSIGLGPNFTTITNRGVGTYYVTITASDACFTVDSAQILSPGAVVLDSVRLTAPTCPGESNGRILLFPNSGTAPYTYTWSTNPNEPGTINPLTNLSAGTYTVTITDANNCTPLVETIVVSDPPAITGDFSSLTPVSCPDDNTCNGAATFQASYSDGTTGSFNFVWSNGVTQLDQGSSAVNMLCRGPISVSVSDGACGVTFEDTIQSPEDIVIGVEIDRVSCFGLSDGSVTLNPSGGTGMFSFQWLQSGGTSNEENNLSAGTYTALVTDANGCARQQVVEVTQPNELELSLNAIETTDAVSCAGDADGIISVFVSSSDNNPLLPAPYTWSGGVGLPTSNVATDLSPGTYSVTVTDTKGCTDELSYTIGEPTPITFSVLPIEEPLCFGQTTQVLIDTAFGGRSSNFEDFTFSVNNDGFRIPVNQSGATFAGQTIVTVFDTVGCSASDTFSVNQPPQILVDLPERIVVELGDSLTVLNPIISPAGDVYNYQWTPADYLSSDTVRAPRIFPFESRDYVLNITNANGCQASAQIFVEVDANRNVFIPNVFSPNRDGRNEDFRIFACQGVQSVNYVRVFDRWGGQIYQQENMAPNCLDGIQLWDGMYRGKPVNPGVYVYIVEVSFLDGKKLLYRGDVAVLR